MDSSRSWHPQVHVIRLVSVLMNDSRHFQWWNVAHHPRSTRLSVISSVTRQPAVIPSEVNQDPHPDDLHVVYSGAVHGIEGLVSKPLESRMERESEAVDLDGVVARVIRNLACERDATLGVELTPLFGGSHINAFRRFALVTIFGCRMETGSLSLTSVS